MEILGVTDTVAQYLRERIITNAFKSGQKLNEIELASQLNISRAPLREAFRVLENEHLLVRLPRKGTFVTEASVRSLRDLYSARKMIECYVIDVLKSGKIQHLPSVYASVTQASELSLPKRDNRQEILNYLKGITDFHVKLVASTRNPWIVDFYDSIATNLARFQYFCIWIPGLTRDSQSSHEEIYRLLSAGSYDEAKELLVSHIDYTVGFIENYVEKESIGDLQMRMMKEAQ